MIGVVFRAACCFLYVVATYLYCASLRAVALLSTCRCLRRKRPLSYPSVHIARTSNTCVLLSFSRARRRLGARVSGGR